MFSKKVVPAFDKPFFQYESAVLKAMRDQNHGFESMLLSVISIRYEAVDDTASQVFTMQQSEGTVSSNSDARQ